MKAIEANHVYEVPAFEGGEAQKIVFVNKFNEGTVHDGTTTEEVLKVLIHRAQWFQDPANNKFPSRENALAITKLQEALMWLEHRTALRAAQGVEGKDAAHKSE